MTKNCERVDRDRNFEISHTICRSSHKFSGKSIQSLTNGCYIEMALKVLKKNILIVKLGKCVQFEMEFENML